MNLAALITAGRPDATALTFEGQEWSFSELDARVQGFAEAFAQQGIGRGDRVAVLLPNRPEVLLAWLAALKLGAVVVPLNPRLTAGEVAFIVGDCEPRLVLADETTAFDGATAVEALDAGPGAAGVPPLDLDASELAMIGYTSGTTGTPKGVMHSHRSVRIAIDGLAGFFGIGAGDSLLAILPLYSLPAMLGGPLMVWSVGGSCHLQRRFEPRACAAALGEHRPTLLGSVPTMLFDLVALPEAPDLSSVRYVMTGGAPLTPRTRADFERRFDLRICNVYGQTEAPMVVSADPLDGERPEGAVGRALDHIELTIRDDAGRVLPPGEVGEVCVGAARPGSYEPMLGYLGRPDATAETLCDGVLHTGDVGRMDAEGFLYLIDRKNDVILRGGVNVYPAEVEAALMQHEDVLECAVYGVPSERLGEVPVAAVVARPGSGLDPERLSRWLDGRLASYKRPAEIVLRDELPKNVLGKTLRRVLREQAVAT